MFILRTVCVGLIFWACTAGLALAEGKKPELSEKEFRRLSVLLMEDPHAKLAPEYAKAVVIYVMETPGAAVMLGEEEMKWIGKDDKRSLLLLSAYLAGNAQSQIHSGVKRNDRYSGLLYLFQVYRQLKAKDKDFRIAEVEKLLKLHKEDKLLKHLVELEMKKPTKLTPEQEDEIRRLLKDKK